MDRLMNTKTRGRYATPRKSHTPLLAVLLILGLAVAGCAGTASADAPEPEIVTETVTETVEVVPQSCLDALDHGERLSGALDWTLGWVGKYLDAVADLDPVRMGELNGELTAQTDSGAFSGVFPEFEAAAQECRELAEG